MQISRILGIIAVIIILLLLLLFVMHDILAVIRYFRATKTKGEIIEKIGEEKFAFYGDRTPRRVFGKYRIRYTDDMGRRCEGTLLVKKRDLSFGAQINVRYEKTENGTCLVDDVYVRRFSWLLIAIVIGGMWGLACYYTSVN